MYSDYQEYIEFDDDEDEVVADGMVSEQELLLQLDEDEEVN